MPRYDKDWFDGFAKKWGESKGVEVTVDHINLAEIGALYAEPSQEAGIAIQLTVPPQPLRFPLDPDQMRQALGNLMLNAIQASPPNTPIKVTPRPERRGAGLLTAKWLIGSDRPDRAAIVV